jgi:predicted ATPase
MNNKRMEISLSRIHFKNFKAFREADINLAPITVIAGVNSSGKSSILQGLLLARNTLATSNIRQKETPLVYEKPLPFTEFEELVFGYPSNGLNHGGSEWHEMTLGLDQTIHINSNTANKYFPRTDSPSAIEIGLEVKFGRQSRKQPVTIRAVALRATPVGGDPSDHSLALSFEPGENGQWKITYLFQKQEQHIEQAVEFDHFLPDLEGRGKPSNKDGEVKKGIYTVYKDLFSPALSRLRDQLTQQLHYIGPLRSAPEPSITQQQIDGLDVGLAGEKTIQLLYDRIEEGRDVDFVRIDPDLDQFNLNHLKSTRLDLNQALSSALHLMGIEQHLQIKKQGVSYQASLSLHQEEHYVPITDVGFGISQVLPIVAVCLLAQPGDLLVFEQPEIHLHPRAQAGLADLLLCTALSGKQVIIETHSDHLINRLRRRLAEFSAETDTPAPHLVNLVFVSPPKAAGQGATVENAQLDQKGNISNWPAGFLAESAKEARAILLAQAAQGNKKS